ncbi:condensation domain-containing protein [Kribbella sp. CA-293567]|uniref:condensation domain-containing protein n=1 Tax=Kribbella sp. CA-293567 TaxID=3002436 RepID=UPI0022DDA746|nr:condensation domain-containing protein [Kribbella sp. CA-293567]WBQ07169.1 condensation domain-containing protein [Kribbella sp. CA-293567]
MNVPTSLWQTFALEMDERRPGFAKGPWFTMNAVLALDGELRADLLADAFHQLQQRHEVLRTEVLDERLQLIHSEPRSALELVTELSSHAPVELDRPIRLRLAGNQLALHLHHLVSDPATLWETVSELAVLYTAALAGDAVPPPVAQYREYATAEAEHVRRTRADAINWWNSRVRDAKICPQPNSTSPTQPAEALAFRDDLLDPTEVSRVEELTRRHRSTPLVTYLAALAHGMEPQVGPGDTLLFTTLFGKRDRPEWQQVLGPCIVPSYLAIPRGSGSLDADVGAMREAVVGCSRYSRYPNAQIYETVDSPQRTPFFEYVPQQWPAGFAFGPVNAVVTAAAGPKDTGLADALAIRVRTRTDGVLTGHFSADGTDWSEPLVHQVRTGFRSYLLHEEGS